MGLSYLAIHKRMYRAFPKKGRCERCGATGLMTHYASIGHRYTLSREDWLELCVKCHSAVDGRSAPSHCVNGHEYTPENTRIKRNGTRCCKHCHTEEVRRQRQK